MVAGTGVLFAILLISALLAVQRRLDSSRAQFIDPLANRVDASAGGGNSSELREPSLGVLAERVDLPTRSSTLEPDLTRLHLTARPPGASRAGEGSIDGPLEGARFELITRDSTRTATPIRVQHTVIASVGDSTVVELPSTVQSAEVIASASGYAPGRIQVEQLRVVGGKHRPSGLVERSVEVELTRHEPRRCLHGSLSVDGIPGAPDDLELALCLANGRPVREAEFVIDRSANTYCLAPLDARPARLRVLGQGVVPLWLEIPDERPEGALLLDIEMSSGRSAFVRVVDADTGVALLDHPLRVEISAEAWRDAGTHGDVTRLAVLRTDRSGVLAIEGLPHVGRLVVNSVEPPHQLANGVLNFAPGKVYLDRDLTADDPSVLKETIRVPSRSSGKCTLFGPRPDPASVESGELTVVLARTTEAGVRLTRHEAAGMTTKAAWELEVEPTGPVQAWLEREERRASAVVAFTTTPGRVGPILFPLRVTTPVELSWSGGVAGDQMTVYGLGGMVDEKLASLALEQPVGSIRIELDGPSELGLVLEREGTSLRRTLTWDPGSSGDLVVDWPSTDVVDVRLDVEGVEAPVSASVLLFPLDETTAPTSLLHVEEGRAPEQRVAPGRYFFLVDDSDPDALICGVTEHVAGAPELSLLWRGCTLSDPGGTVAAAGVIVEAISGVELTGVPARLRTLAPPRNDAENSRPSRLRLPCDCKWSTVRRPVADLSKKPI